MARQRIQDSAFLRTYIVKRLAFPLVAMLVVGIGLLFKTNALNWMGFPVLGIVFIAAFLWQRRLYANYRCRQCKERIQRTADSKLPGAKITFYCPRCDIEWDVGLRKRGG